MHHSSAQAQVNLYLVGFMGTGKTTVGRALAQRLHMTFLDVDMEVERLAGMAIAEIFDREGETAFRRRERDVITVGHGATGCIVSCGGGLILQEGMVGELRKRGVVICLTATPETILQRTASNKNRPLLNVEDPAARVREMLLKREPLYREAGTQVLTDFRPLPEIIAHVQRVYLREAREFVPPKRDAGSTV
ncbi:MAG: shikimate kinase [Opitutaceae bacterium]